MYESESFIKESIYESQSHSRPLQTVQQPVISRVASQAPQLNQPTKPDDKTFLKFYEENLHLKNKVAELQRENKELKERLNRQDENARKTMMGDLKNQAIGKRNQWDTIKQPLQRGRGGSAIKGAPAGNKVEHLLEIIEHYKGRLLTAEQQAVNLRRQKALLEQDVKIKDRRCEELKEQQPNNNDKEDYQLAQKLKRAIRELQLQKQRGKFMEASAKNLEAKLRALELKSNEIENLKAENRSLQEKVIRLAQLPDFGAVVDKAQDERKGKQLEAKLKLLNERYNTLKDTSTRQEAELKLLQNKLIETTHETASLELENQSLRQQSLSNPLLLKLSSNPELLQKVVAEVQRIRKGQAQPIDRKLQAQRLILEKEELAKQVLALQARLGSIEQAQKQREKVVRLQREEAVASIPQAKASGRTGVIYEGDVAVFGDMESNLPLGSNCFDLFLGQLALLQSLVQGAAGLASGSEPLILATVDFYNHNTEHSKLVQGFRCQLQSQFSFRIIQDDFFLKYLQKGTFQIDLWAAEGSKNAHLGKANIDLKFLVSRSRPRIAPIVSTAVPIYLGQKVMGSLNIIMRMRLPIYDQLQRLRQIGSSQPQGQEQAAVRRLVVQVQEGRGFSQKSTTFVYYSFRMEDYYSKTAKGNAPNWSYMQLLEINYDNDFKNFLRKNELEFVIFDDSVQLQDERDSDVLGSTSVSLLPLLEGKAIQQRLQVVKGNQRKGTIDVKIYWHQLEDEGMDKALKAAEEKKLGVTGVHEQLRSFIKEHSIDEQKVYRLIDSNRTGLISSDEFSDWINRISTRKFTPQTLNSYYKGFKQPLNLANFTIRLSRETISESEPQAVVAGISMINEFLKINSTQMKKKTLEEYLQNKNILEVAAEIETDRLGYIARPKLQQYFDKAGVEAQIESERVKLIDFLRKRQGLRKTL